MGVCASTRGACRGRHEDDGGGDDGSPRHGGGAKTPLHDAVEAGDGAAVKRLLKEREEEDHPFRRDVISSRRQIGPKLDLTDLT